MGGLHWSPGCKILEFIPNEGRHQPIPLDIQGISSPAKPRSTGSSTSSKPLEAGLLTFRLAVAAPEVTPWEFSNKGEKKESVIACQKARYQKGS